MDESVDGGSRTRKGVEEGVCSLESCGIGVSALFVAVLLLVIDLQVSRYLEAGL